MSAGGIRQPINFVTEVSFPFFSFSRSPQEAFFVNMSKRALINIDGSFLLLLLVLQPDFSSTGGLKKVGQEKDLTANKENFTVQETPWVTV